MAKLILHIFDTSQNGPASQVANAAYNASNDIEGTVSSYQGGSNTATYMQALGIKTLPAIAIGRYCPGNTINIKYLAQFPGVPNVATIVDTAAKLAADAQAMNCDIHGGSPLPVASQDGSGSDAGSGGGFGLGLFDLNINLPWWVYAAIAGAAAIGSTSSQGNIAKYGYGVVAVVAGGNAWNKYKKQNG